MKIIDPIDNPTEATMSDTTTVTPRYGYHPGAAFAATHAFAARRARETAATPPSHDARSRHSTHRLHKLSKFFATSVGRS